MKFANVEIHDLVRALGVATQACSMKFIAPLVLVFALGVISAHATEETWQFRSYKNCRARIEFKLPAEIGGWNTVEVGSDAVTVLFYREHLAKLEATVRFLKKCRPWAWDRNKGKAVNSRGAVVKAREDEIYKEQKQ
jgi:hypothetical protein